MSPDLEAPRVAVTAGDPWVRSGLGSAVAEAGYVVIDAAELASTDVHVVDGGWDAAAALEASGGPAPTVVLLADASDLGAALRGGARGVLLRDTAPGRLTAAIEGVAHGVVVLDPALVATGWLARADHEPARLVEPLTAREKEVLALMARGLANRRIAHDLGIAESTVKFHVNAILAKLNAESRTEAVVAAARLGLVEL